MYALNIAEDGRILSVTYPQYATTGMPIVDKLPEGDYNDYRYVAHEPTEKEEEPTWEYIFDPLPKPEPVHEPTELDLIEAQVTYTALQTGTLINQPKGVSKNV